MLYIISLRHGSWDLWLSDLCQTRTASAQESTYPSWAPSLSLENTNFQTFTAENVSLPLDLEIERKFLISPVHFTPSPSPPQFQWKLSPAFDSNFQGVSGQELGRKFNFTEMNLWRKEVSVYKAEGKPPFGNLKNRGFFSFNTELLKILIFLNTNTFGTLKVLIYFFLPPVSLIFFLQMQLGHPNPTPISVTFKLTLTLGRGFSFIFVEWRD